jgi:pyruvate decarboxylase
MANFTVGDYLAERLAQIGIGHHFVVPGDYNLILLDRLQLHPKLSEVGCANELNCSLAAEGYARANRVAACVVTYSVGAFSAFNGTGSAYGENLPLILISGSPNTNDSEQFHILHHTLGTSDFTYQLRMAEQITCCAVAVKRTQDAPRLIDRAIRAALNQKKPVYIEIPTNLSGAPCIRPGPISAVIDQIPSDRAALAAAIDCAMEYVSNKEKPVIVVGSQVRRAGVEPELLRFAEALGCAVAVQPSAKGSFPEDHKQFAGVFWGQVSTLAADTIVNWADAVICVGTIFTDYTTVGWTAVPSVPLMVAEMDRVTFPTAEFGRVRLSEFLSEWATTVPHKESTLTEYKRLRPDPPLTVPLGSNELLCRKEIARQMQTMLTPETTLFVDTGDSWFNGIQMQLPHGAEFEIEMQWGHIGWSIPAAFGYALAKPRRQVLVMVGDGAFQMTAQEVSQMVRHKIPIIIILVNNKGYTIEVEIHDGPYNRIKNWDYALLIQAFNSSDGQGIGLRATTAGQLAKAIKTAKAHRDGPTLIECLIDQDDCSKELISWGHYVAAANSRPPAKP